MLRYEQDVRDAIDAFKLQLGLPLDVPLELDGAPLQPIQEQLARLENVFEEMQQAKSVERATEVAKLRAALRTVMTTFPIVQGTAFRSPPALHVRFG